MNRIFLVIKEIFRIEILLALSILAVIVIHSQVHTVRVVSPSMEPTISAGDLVLIKAIPKENLEVGMVMLIKNPKSNLMYLHRVTYIAKSSNGLEIQTQGDANALPDTWNTLLSDKEAYVMFIRIPLGWIGKALPAF